MARQQVTAEEVRMRMKVEQLLARFYHPNTSNTEKKKLETELKHMRTTTFTWEYCLDNLNTFHNQYLWFFGSSTLEAMLYKWSTLSKSDKQRLRIGLMKLLSSFPGDTPGLQRDKIAQILALVASLQFPEEYPDYIEHVLLLLKERFPIGLALARALGDSITQEKYISCYGQQKQFRAAVLTYIPSLLSVLGPHLKYYISCITPTISQLPVATGPGGLEQCTIELLQMMQQYFSWIELHCVEPSLVESLLQLSVWRQGMEKEDVAISAVSALTELYYRQQPLTPASTKQMVLGIMELLRQPDLQQTDEFYQEKLCDLVRLCTGRELQAKHVLHWEEFFDLLYQFTFDTRAPLIFIERLSTWQMIFRMYCDSLASNVDPQQKLLPDMLVMKVAMGTLERMLFQNDIHHQLELLGDDEVDDNLETEIQHYYSKCIELVEVAAEIAAEQMQEMVLSPLITNDASPYRQVLHILKTISNTRDDGITELCNETNECQLRVRFRDFVPIEQTLSRLCAMFYGKVPAMGNVISWLAQEQLELFVTMSSSMQPVDLLYMRMPSTLCKEMISATAQMLTTLRTLLQLTENKTSQANIPKTVAEPQMMQLLAQLMNYLAPPVRASQTEWRLLAGAAANFLLSVSINQLVSASSLFELLQRWITTSRLTHLDYQTAHAVRKAVCHSLLTQWHGQMMPNTAGNGALSSALITPNTGHVAQRRDLLNQYIRFLANDLLCVKLREWTMVPPIEQHRIVSVLAVELAQLTDLLTHFRQLSSAAKAMLASAFREVIEKVLDIYGATQGNGLIVEGDEPGCHSKRGVLINTLLDFCHAVIESLQVQLGEAFLQQLIQLFLQRARAEALAREHLRSLEALLGIFVLIVEQPGNRSLIADIVLLCVDDVLPVAFSVEYQSKPDSWRHSELCVTLFRLFHSVLLHRWKYFVKPQLLQQQSPSVANEAQYAAIMNGYGMVITTVRDAHLVRGVLESLQTLNERCKLFREPFFANRYLPSFMYAMLNLLTSYSGGVYHELLAALLFDLASANPPKFVEIIFTVGHTVKLDVRNNLCHSTDLPTFTQHMNEFVGYARTSNRLLSPDDGNIIGF